MDMDARCPMTTDTHLLTLMQWLSPGFPLGTFSYSHGLECAVTEGRVVTALDLQGWLHAVLSHGAGSTDAILLAESYRSDAPKNVDDLGRALASSRERLLETAAQGEAFCTTVNAVWGTALPRLSLPVAVGAAARSQHIPLALTLQAYLHAFAAGLVSAAQRAMPIGQVEAQKVLASVLPPCLTIAERARTQTLDDLGSCAFMTEIAAMRHETLTTRIFRS